MQLYVVAKILQSVFLEFKCAGLKALAGLKTHRIRFLKFW